MSKNTYKNTDNSKEITSQAKMFVVDKRLKIALGLILQGVSLFLFTALVAHFISGQRDQHIVESASEIGWKTSGLAVENWLGSLGAKVGYYFVFRWWGVTAFLFLPPLYLTGHKLITERFWSSISLFKTTLGATFLILWGNMVLGYTVIIMPTYPPLSILLGGVAYELGVIFESFIGSGTIILAVTTLLVFLVLFFNITALPASIMGWLTNEPRKADIEIDQELEIVEKEMLSLSDSQNLTSSALTTHNQGGQLGAVDELPLEVIDTTTDVALVEINQEDSRELKHAEQPAEQVENYDPKLDLSSYQYPTINLLEQYDNGKLQVTQEELAQNKDKIVETLINFKIGIASIKATIGPTVTLYEIVPEAGVKISKIKNLEDDIALSLAALGIRIIAPIPGKGTIGIEVPNKNREIVPLRALLATEKFMKSSMELPIVLGRSISNETVIADLAKMPHLLIAGATGQGKSVGLNVLLASLIYKKHPSQLKLVLVDPKKVELSLYNKLERHFLAKLPNSEEAIITETKKVVHTLNSLCIEMDHRYELLKEAGTRNIREYNEKFVKRKLNPQQGHSFLPYIVLVIDEFADMMMTAGKEVEVPVARLAQLARAIGIHLVLATQRPSVNVITGIIKANFPVRISFKVTSRIDSRTILDAGGAEQLVGQGDLLVSMNSDIVRLQCPFLDTAEVERVCAYVGEQRGYQSAYLLPTYEEEDGVGNSEIDLKERDALFEEAARLIVMHQQGSTSLIQRKLKLGYNRAGRLIDQLEAAGIVGPFEGSKAREVLVQDEPSLELILNALEEG